MHVWLQRDTPGRQSGPLLQSTLEAVSDNPQIDGLRAVSSLATGSRSVVVGAQRLNNGSRSPYSPVDHVNAFAAADESAVIGGLLCAGGLSGSLVRMSSTSAAAPLVARSLANQATSTSTSTSTSTGTGTGTGTDITVAWLDEHAPWSRFNTGGLAQTVVS